MANQAKMLRSQIRQIVKEILPELLASETIAAIESRVSKDVHTKMEVIAKTVKETMQTIDERSKTVSSYLVTQVSKPTEQPKKD